MTTRDEARAVLIEVLRHVWDKARFRNIRSRPDLSSFSNEIILEIFHAGKSEQFCLTIRKLKTPRPVRNFP